MTMFFILPINDLFHSYLVPIRSSYGSRDLLGGDRDFDSAASIETTVSAQTPEDDSMTVLQFQLLSSVPPLCDHF